jgi:hypothetical protein
VVAVEVAVEATETATETAIETGTETEAVAVGILEPTIRLVGICHLP